MNLIDYIQITDLALDHDYKHAESGEGFVVPGESLIASISPTEPINYIALLHFIQDQPRANHYHKLKTEYLVVLKGKLNCVFYLVDNPENKYEVTIEPGKVVKINPGCVHIITAIDGEAYALEMSPQKLDLSDQIKI